jgi:DNA-binding transcriptional ArsR family regulator
LADDLVTRTRRELQERIAELEALVTELPRLKAALKALGGSGETRRQASSIRSRAGGGGARRRRPRGANRKAILAVLAERPGVSVGELAAALEEQGVKKNVTYSTVNKLANDGVISKDDGALTVISGAAAS